MSSVTRYDFVELKAQRTDEGFIRDSPIITRAGIFEYRDASGKVVREFRSDAEVFKAESLASCMGAPITDGHYGLVSSGNLAHVVGAMLSAGRQDGKDVRADIMIHDSRRIGAKRELSLGYTCDIDPTPGEFEGKRYDQAQTNIKYNHLAVVTKGRAGNARLRLDAADDRVSGTFDTEDVDMPEPKLMATVRIDNLEYQASPEVANRLVKLETDLGERQKVVDTVSGERDALKTQLADAVAEQAKIRKAAFAEARDRINLEQLVSGFGLKFEETEDNTALKVKAIKKFRPSIELDGKSEDYIGSAFDMTIAYEQERKGATSTASARADSARFKLPASSPAGNSAASARERMLAKIRGEKVDSGQAA